MKESLTGARASYGQVCINICLRTGESEVTLSSHFKGKCVYFSCTTDKISHNICPKHLTTIQRVGIESIFLLF